MATQKPLFYGPDFNNQVICPLKKLTKIDMTKPTQPKPGEMLPGTIVEQLKQLIYVGEFKPGDRLNEAALALRMGTSRGPIREAIAGRARAATAWRGSASTARRAPIATST